MTTMNVSLPKKLKDWAEARVESGRYANVSDYVRDLIRKEQDKAVVFDEIQAALDEGDASGYRNYSRAEIETELNIATDKNAA